MGCWLGGMASTPFWRAALAATWFRLLEPGPGEEDMGRKGGLEHVAPQSNRSEPE